jgi:Uma2 family endonuclease
MTILDRPSVVVPVERVSDSSPSQGQWTYDDYMALPDDGKRYEVVNGVLYMAPASSTDHQRVCGAIFAYLYNVVQLKGRGSVFSAPTDVELRPGDVVQPDVFVMLQEHNSRILPSRVSGAPDLVVEVASPSTARHDLREKQDAYARADVPEYWIVSPGEHVVEVLLLKQGAYYSLGLFGVDASLPSRIIAEEKIPVERFFAFL